MSVTIARTQVARSTPGVAFVALLMRDVNVLRKNLVEFVIRSIMQPLLFVFVFTYVFPKIGFGVGGSGAGETVFSSLLVPGVVAIACMFQGVQAVALPHVQELGFTREIEDRVMAPLPIWSSRWPRSSRRHRCTWTRSGSGCSRCCRSRRSRAPPSGS